MIRLVLLNGPPACGKSTLARRYVDDHPLALALDVDVLRDMLGRWRDEPHEAGLRARALALTAVRAHLAAGYDVVVPQLLAAPQFLDELRAVAAETGAAFHEVVLADTRENARRRYAERARDADDPYRERIGELYDRVVAFVATRPDACRVAVIDGDPAGTYRALIEALGR